MTHFALDKKDELATFSKYRIICTCGSVYVATTKRSVNTTIRQYKAHCRLGHTEKSAITEPTLNNTYYGMQFEQILTTTSFSYAQIVLKGNQNAKTTLSKQKNIYKNKNQ